MRQKVREGDTFVLWPGHLSTCQLEMDRERRARVRQTKRRRRQINRPAHVRFFLSFFFCNKYIYFCIMRFGILLEASERARAARDTCQLLAYVTHWQARAHTPSSVRTNQLSWLARRG